MKKTKFFALFIFLFLFHSAFALFSSSSADSKDPQAIKNINPQILKLALNAYHCVVQKGMIKNPLLTIVDFTRPSIEKRMWVIDPAKQISLYELHVSHGVNSGYLIPSHFSNDPSSLESSLGAYLTSTTYDGHHGYSLVLIGLEKGINSNAEKRHIILHSAWYVTPGFIHQNDSLGRSWGCFALNPSLTHEVIDTLKGGSLLFAYGSPEDTDSYIQRCEFSIPSH